MTYESQIQSSLDNIVDIMYDGISTMTGWNVIVDERTGSGYFVMEAPVSNQHVLISGRDSNPGGYGRDWGFSVTHGYNWDISNNVFSGTQWGEADIIVDDDYQSAHESDNCQYWFERHPEKGFIIAIRRNVGDGNDEFGWIYYNIVDAKWDNQMLENADDDMPIGVVGANSSRSVNGTWWDGWGRNHVGQTGRGILNPDGEWSNYTWVEHNWEHTRFPSQYSNGDDVTSQNIPEGTTDMWLRDLSGSTLNTGDVIQDTNGNDLYEIVEYHGKRVAIKME